MKQFLHDNKIYFETVVAILLGSMAIIVSFSQLWLAYKSYELSKLPYLPQIVANVSSGGEYCEAESWELTTTNLSGNAYDVRVHPIAFLRINELQSVMTGETPSPNISLKTALIPIERYFTPVSNVTSTTQGELVIQCTQSIKGMNSSKREFESLYKLNKDKSITSHEEIYMFVSYLDRFGNSQRRYFQVNAAGVAVPIPGDLGQNIFNRHTRMVDDNQSLEYGSSTGSEIMRVWRINAS